MSPSFGPDVFDASGRCRWILTEVPGLRAGEAFIAGPAPGEDRGEWLDGLRAYRERVRGGEPVHERRALFAGRGILRMAFHPARELALRPGRTLSLSVDGRWQGGGNELTVTFDACDPCTEAMTERRETGARLSFRRDGTGQRLQATVVVPVFSDPVAVLRPCLETRGDSHVELRDVSLGGEARAARGGPGGITELHDRPDLRWASRIFTCHFTFLYDHGIIGPDGAWKIDDLLRDGQERFGGYDAVVLWQAYPRIGVDPRNQLDHYRDLPGGLESLAAAIRRFHERGVRVFVDYNPWDTGTRREAVPDEEALADLVKRVDADGIFLDTMSAAPGRLREAVDRVRPGVVFAPEGHPSEEQLGFCNASWGQSLHDPEPPGLLRLKWIEPRHMQHQVRRWDLGHRGEIETAFFNGSGMLVWENVFGTHNAWPADDAVLWKCASRILRSFADAFTGDGLEPFVPTRTPGVHAHRWSGAGFTLYTLRGGTGPGAADLDLAAPAQGEVIVDLFDGWPVRGSLGCVYIGPADDPRLLRAREQVPGETAPHAPARSVIEPVAAGRAIVAGGTPAGMAHVPDGSLRLKLTHVRRECGCYPDPGSSREDEKRFLWGSPHDGLVEHDYTVELSAFLVDTAQVSNADYRRFLRATGWKPRDPVGFLAHWPGGAMPEAVAELPVVNVDLDDARAYARWAGRRLPTEPEWQRAAQGTDGRAWPWGPVFDPARCARPGSGPLAVRSLPEGRSPVGCYHMSGNAWEWTESERNDGHTRFVIIRGGSWFRPVGSLWYVQGGPQPCTSHTKLLLLAPSLDRSPTIGFRCAADPGSA